MAPSDIHISTTRPHPPEEADFAIDIDFKRGHGSPQRVFRAADKMIQELQRVDEALCASVDTSIKTVMMLEDIEAGSIRIWLKNVLESTEDQAIKELDWRPAVGKYLVRGKYVYIRWANKTDPGLTLIDLARDLRTIASETDIKHLPDYAPPQLSELAEAVQEIDEAKRELSEGDRITYRTKEDDPVDFDMTVEWSGEELSDMLIKETTKFENMPMNLIVKKPDYLGESMWDLRHGRKQIMARIDDRVWLDKFQARKIDVRPGDALKCLVTIEHHYGHDNELVSETHEITKVEAVLENQIFQGALFTENDGGK